MKKSIYFALTACLLFTVTSCFEDLDDNLATSNDVKDFIYQAMFSYYLYKDNVPNLQTDMSSAGNYNDYLNSYNSPESFFESLIYQRQTIDKYSWIVDDYFELQQQIGGTTLNNGMEYGLFRFSNTDTDVYGYVRYVLPGTDAESKGLQRGDIFHAVNGTQLTVSNYYGLLSNTSYSITLGAYNDNGTSNTTSDDYITDLAENINLTKSAYTENPIYTYGVIDVNGENVGYLMYNGFTQPFNNQLNDVFGYFVSNNIQKLVLDLRYNPGGSVYSASLMGSCITGQFTGSNFTTLVYNSNHQDQNTVYPFLNTIDGNTVNSLQLDNLYVIATGSSASASEMVINSLRPYIDVVHVGVNTEGKSQASRTLYDSPDDFRSQNINPTHTYALQPLVAQTRNNSNNIVPSDGLIPDIQISEYFGNLGVLGDENEPLLAAALQTIIDGGRMAQPTVSKENLIVADSKDLIPHSKDMIID